jgi:hypothetical protein
MAAGMAQFATDAIHRGADCHQFARDRLELPLKLPAKPPAHDNRRVLALPAPLRRIAAAQMTTRDLPLTAGDLDTQKIHNATMKIALFRQLSQIQVLASSSLPEWWDAG